MPNFDLKVSLSKAIHQFADLELSKAAISLLNVLGYSSDKRLVLSPNTKEQFSLSFDPQHKLDEKKSLYSSWQAIDLLFQLTDEEIKKGLGGQSGIFENKQVDNSIINSYLFFSLELSGEKYSRSDLAQVTREINKLFLMPVMVIFKHNGCITIGIVSRRLNKKDASRDVLEKVTLIKDIHISEPHHGQIDILSDLALENLARTRKITNFVDLQKAWEDTLDVSVLNKKFYKEIQSWYFWAVKNVTFPDGAGPDLEQRNQTSVIRMITRLIFVWFIKEKGLVPEELFDEAKLKDILVSNDLNSSVYYKAILQNLFFATLNTEMGEGRKFRSEYDSGRDGHYLIHNVYRYKKYFKDPEAALNLFSVVPFLNGGLFECLDKEVEEGGKREVFRIDGFSDRDDNPISIPGKLFFGSEHEEDLSDAYGDRSHAHDKVRGLLEIFKGYKFTIEENTPIEEEIALDPELLGKVFENLLAAYNPETGTTARKQTGSFYTPREIVNYMVDEALIAYLDGKLNKGENNQERFRNLFAYNLDPNPFNTEETKKLVEAIDEIKVLDPACGSGAFPMGVLHKLVFILTKLDPENTSWRALQRQKAINETEEAYKIGDQEERRQRLLDIEEAFENNSSDYGRKLYLIENCIYGVDIQPIAVQISKLRFFISLVVDQEVQYPKMRFAFRSLPNLESKFVAANSLISIEEPRSNNATSQSFTDHIIREKKIELKELRHKMFRDRTPKLKHEHREKDKLIRLEIVKLLEADWGETNAKKLASWDPYDQNLGAEFFDPDWMFGINDGFDIVIGNPPYIFARDSEAKGITKKEKNLFIRKYLLAEYQINLYPLFIEQGTNLLKEKGILVFITPNNWMTINSNKKLRSFILQKSNISIVNFYAKVFESASVDSSIIIFSNSQDNPIVKLYEFTNDIKQVFRGNVNIFLNQPNQIINLDNFRNKMSNNIIEKIEKSSIKLKDISTVKAGLKAYEVGKGTPPQSKEMKDSRIYHSTSRIDKTYFKYLDGKDVCRYFLGWSGEYLKYGKNLAAPRGNFNLFSSQRILVRQIPSKPPYCINACLTNETALNDLNSINIIDMEINPEVILAFLNSRLISYWFISRLGKMQRGTFPQFKVNELEEFPIHKRVKIKQEILVRTVQQIICMKAKDKFSDTYVFEQEIDQIIYQLYELTEEEINIVEGGNGVPN